MIYQTENPEIIELYNTYNELNNFIEYFVSSKRQFMNYYNIKKSSTYYAFPNDKFGYSNEKKVSKIFMEGLNINEIQKYIQLHFNLENDYILAYGALYIKTYKNRTLTESYTNEILHHIINFDRILFKLRQMIKQLLKLKLENKVIPQQSEILL